MKKVYPHTKRGSAPKARGFDNPHYGVGVYLDYAASTPVDPAVERAMKPYFGKIFANAHSLHRFGQEASAAIFDARKKIAKSIGANYQEIVFTGSATEANNLAIRGIIKSYWSNKSCKTNKSDVPEIITLTIEHESVLETCRDLERQGVKVHYVPVSRDGLVDVERIKKVLNKNTVLVSVIYANNEIGTIQPMSEISTIIRDFRKSKIQSSKSKISSNNQLLITNYPLFHTDAVQALQYLDCDVENLGLDLMTISAHKIYGPKGIGALYVRSQVSSKQQVISTGGKTILHSTNYLLPIITGSGQEGGLRSGTDNTPYIVGFGEALAITMKMREKETKRIKSLRDYFWMKLKKALPKIELNGSLENRLPNNLNIYFPGHKNQELLIKLDLAGVASSPGAACSTRVSKISFVLEALGFPEERAGGSLRFSLGRQTTKADIDYATSVIKKIVIKK